MPRRQLLIDSMFENEDKGNDCSQCEGTCCTFVSNSMQTTLLETKEIYEWLEVNGLWTEELIQKLKDTVRKYRLDYSVGTGRKSIRKTYTCPFFHHKKLGCGLDLNVKPYGCLAFNPRQANQKEGDNCASNLEILEQREREFEGFEKQESRNLAKKHKIIWEKAPLPLALLDFDNSLDNI